MSAVWPGRRLTFIRTRRVWELLFQCERCSGLCILGGVYNELFRVRGFSAGCLVRGNRIHVVYFSQAYVSPPLESKDSHPVLIIEMTSCYCEIRRGGGKSNPSQSVHLATDCMEGPPCSSCLFDSAEDNWISWASHCTWVWWTVCCSAHRTCLYVQSLCMSLMMTWSKHWCFFKKENTSGLQSNKCSWFIKERWSHDRLSSHMKDANRKKTSVGLAACFHNDVSKRLWEYIRDVFHAAAFVVPWG